MEVQFTPSVARIDILLVDVCHGIGCSVILGAFAPFSKNPVPRFESVAVLIRVEPHLSGLIGTASHQDIQKFRIIGFVF